MTALPGAGFFSALTTKNGTAKQALDNVRSYLAGLFGEDGTVVTARATLGVPGTADVLAKANNLSDLVSPATARTNLGLGTAAIKATGTSTGQVPLAENIAGLGNLALISTATAASSATIDFTGLDGTYDRYLVIANKVVPAVDNTEMQARAGVGATPTWVSTASYEYAGRNQSSAAAGSDFGGIAQDRMAITRPGTGVGNDVGENLSFDLWIDAPSSSLHHALHWSYVLRSNAGATIYGAAGGHHVSTTPMTAIRFFMSSGNIASGVFSLYGVRK